MRRWQQRLAGPAMVAVIWAAPAVASGSEGDLAAQAATGPPTLIRMDQAVQLALERNQNIRAQRLNIDQSRANETTAGLKPNPTFSFSATGVPAFQPSQLGFGPENSTQVLTGAFSYLFERGGKRDWRVTVARDTTQATVYGVTDAERQLRFQVEQAFINVLLAKSNLALAEEDLKDFSDVVEINRQRMQSGDLAEADFLKISIQKLQFEQDLSAAQVALVQAKAALRQQIGYETVAENFDVVGDLTHKKYTLTLEELQRAAVESRPDLLAAQANTKVASDTVSLAFANRVRDVTGETDFERNAGITAVGVGLSFDLPIHNRNQGEIARSQFAVTQAKESESSARIGVLTDVVNAYSSFRTNDQVASLYESGYLEQARQSREISNYAYRRGASSLLDLLDAERTYRVTQLAYRQALAAYLTSAAQINFVVGKQVIQ